MDLPVRLRDFPPHPVVGPHTDEGLGLDLNIFGGILNTSAAWPTANKAFFYPFLVEESGFTIAQLGWVNGTAVSGNVDAGVYDLNGNRKISTGSTAQSGTTAIQLVDVADTGIDPGIYFIALVLDNTTGTVHRTSNPTNALWHRTMGCFEAATSFPLPSSVSKTAIATNTVPMVFLTRRATL